MREIPEAKLTQDGGIRRLLGASLIAGALGVFAGASFFPVLETKIVEKRVEVPVEVIKYVDRMVDKVVEKRVEIPIKKIVYRSASAESDPLDEGNLLLRVGMRKSQVFGLIGRPYFDDNSGNLHYYSISSRMHLRLQFDGEELVQIIHPK